MADCLELQKGSLYMDQILRDIPVMRDWVEEFDLKERFFLYNEYGEPRYCIEVHEENNEFVVHLLKITDDVEFFGDLLKQIKYALPNPKMPITIVTSERFKVLWRQLKWKRYTEEVHTDNYNRTRYIYRSKR